MACTQARIETKQYYEQALVNAVSAVTHNVSLIGDRNPKLGNPDFSWDYCDESDWVAGFWTGQLWLTYKITAEPRLLHSARLRRPYFQRLLDNPDWMDHDLGFQFILTCVADYRLTGDRTARDMAVTAADALLGRFKRIGRFIVAWNESHDLGSKNQTQFKTIIDSLQNVSLLFWASLETGNPLYRDAAVEHSNTLMKHLVRDDYSTFHTFNFDPVSEEPVGGETFQGYADESCWSRGQAWAVHGYAQIFSNTGDEKYLTLAKKLADYVIERMPDSGIPLWDYDLPSWEYPYRDSSAGAITASGLLLIARHCGNQEQADHYRLWGLHMLGGLIRECDISHKEGALGLLDGGASFVKIGLCNNMLPYGDYYYLEALMRANSYSDYFGEYSESHR